MRFEYRTSITGVIFFIILKNRVYKLIADIIFSAANVRKIQSTARFIKKNFSLSRYVSY